jgi:hypothetical protein
MSEQQVRVWVGAFGKHPGWDDHLADQGLETELLTQVKRLLYIEGIGGNIDSGAWVGLEEDERVDGFDHVFLWRWAGGLVVGRLWSSSDGKGRTRYPMIVCAHCRGIASSWVAEECLGAIEELASKCKEATDAAGVITAVDDSRRSLRAMAETAPLASCEPLPPPTAIVELNEKLGDEGLARVCYQMEREFSSFLLTDEDTGTRSRTIDVRPRSMRVPSCIEDTGQACRLWIRFMLERMDPNVPVVAVIRRGGGYCDLIAGEPTRGQFFCFQGSLERLPLTTEIPYTIDDGFLEKIHGRVEAGRVGTLHDVDPGCVEEQPVRSLRTPKTPDRSQIKLIAIVLIGIVVVIAIIAAVLKMAGSSGGATTSDSTPEKVAAPEVVVDSGERPAAPEAEIQAREAAFLDWGKAFQSWFGPLAKGKGHGREMLASDEYLAKAVLEPLDQARADGIALNPLDAVSNPPPTLTDLLSSPPESISGDRVWSSTQSALAVINEVRLGLEGWPVRLEAIALADRLEHAGIAAPAAPLRSAADQIGPNGTGPVLDAIEALSEVGSTKPIEDVLQRVEQIQTTIEKMRRSGDAVLLDEAGTLSALVAKVQASDDLKQVASGGSVLTGVAQLASTVGAFIDDGLAEVDPVVFEAQGKAYQSEDRGVERLRLWLSEARSPQMQRLDPSLDPRGSADIARKLGTLVKTIEGIDARGREAFSAEFSAIVEQGKILGREWDALEAMPWNTQTRGQIEQQTRAMTQQIARVNGEVMDLRAMVSVDAAERLADIKARDTVSTTGLESIDELWGQGRDALVARYESDQDDTALFRDSRVLAAALSTVEDATLIGESSRQIPATWDSGAMHERTQSMRNAAVSEYAADFATGAVEPDQIAGIVSQIESSISASASALNALIESIIALETHLDELFGLEESWLDDRSIKSVVQVFGAKEKDARAIAPPVFARVDALERVAAAGSKRDELVALLESPQFPEVGFVAGWFAVADGDPAWPRGAAELGRDLEFASRVRTAIKGVDDRERVAQLEDRIGQELRQRWAVATEHSSDWTDLEASVQLRQVSGGSLEDLGNPTRFNLLVLAIADAIDADKDDAWNQSSISALLSDLDDSSIDDSAARDWLDRVEAVVSEDVDELPPLDPAGVGPALAGWRVVDTQAEDRLVYESSWDEPVRLAFRLVVLPDGRGAYVCETELSVGVVAGLAQADPEFAQAIGESLEWFDSQRDSRVGMLVWEWAGTKDEPELVPAASWVSAVWVPEGEYFAGGQPVAYPTVESPMQRLSLSDAMFIAARLGCRLPTDAEWLAAYTQVRGVALDSGWNLRDQRFVAQVQFVEANGESWRQAMMPDADALEQLRGEPSGSFDDGKVWVGEVEGGPDGPFRQIIGNVHEFVIVDPLGQEEALGSRSVPPGAETPDRWYAVARSVRAGVMGGSVFSSFNASVDEVAAVKDVPGGWSDVGVRLAFSPESGRVRRSVSARVKSLVESAPFLPVDERKR